MFTLIALGVSVAWAYSVTALLSPQIFPLVMQREEGGSVDVYFGPKAPAGMEHNWVQTIPGKGWFMILRLYGPLEPWFAKTWRPGEIALQP